MSFVCGTHRAYIYQMGGIQLVAELSPLASVRWNRKRDDISDAEATVPTNECCELLGQLRTIRHELHIARNGGFVWQGVITRIEYEFNETRIYAEDLMWVLRRTAIEVGYSQAHPNIGLALDRMEWLFNHGYGKLSDIWNMLPHLHKLVGVDGPKTARTVYAWQMSVWEDIDKYAEDYGCDYVVVNRDIYYFDVHLRWYILPPLNENYLSDIPRVVEYGAQAGNRGIVTNARGFAGVSDPSPDQVAYYGFIDQITTNEIDGQPVGDPTPDEIASWKETAARSVTESFPAPLSMVIPANTTLLPGSEWEIRHLVPGAWFQCKVLRPCRPVEEWQRIQEVRVEEIAPQGETVQFTAISAPASWHEPGFRVEFPPDPIPIDPILPPIPIPPIPCTVWADDFGRDVLGPSYQTPPEHQVPNQYDALPFTVETGALVCQNDVGSGTHHMWGTCRRMDVSHGSHFIELVVTNLDQGATAGQLELYAQLNGVNASRRTAYFSLASTVAGAVWDVESNGAAGSDESGGGISVARSNTMTFRLESYTNGQWRVLIDGTIVAGGTIPSGPQGDYVGFAMNWVQTGGKSSPRILEALGGCIFSSPGPVPPSCSQFSDDFERANGALGANWVGGVNFLGYAHLNQTIVSGRAEVPHEDSGSIGNMLHVGDVPGDHFIEVDAANLWQALSAVGNGGFVVETEFWLLCRANTADQSCIAGYFSPNAGNATAALPTADRANWTGSVYVEIFKVSATGVQTHIADGDLEPFPPWRDNPPVTFRLESYASGAVSAYVDGVLVCAGSTATAGLPTGDLVGWGPQWHHTNYLGIAHDGTAVQTLAVRGGCLECQTFTDTFDRADGAVGPNWVVGPITSNETPELMTISSGAVIGPFNSLGPVVSDAIGSMSWATEMFGPDQFMEVAFENWFLDATSTTMRVWVYNFGGLDAFGVMIRRSAMFEMRKPLGVLQVSIQSGTFTVDGDTPPEVTTNYSPYTGTTGPRTLRLESYASGRQVVLLDGAVVQDYVSTATFTGSGHTQGVHMDWTPAGSRTSPRILSVTGGCLEG